MTPDVLGKATLEAADDLGLDLANAKKRIVGRIFLIAFVGLASIE